MGRSFTSSLLLLFLPAYPTLFFLLSFRLPLFFSFFASRCDVLFLVCCIFFSSLLYSLLFFCIKRLFFSIQLFGYFFSLQIENRDLIFLFYLNPFTSLICSAIFCFLLSPLISSSAFLYFTFPYFFLFYSSSSL